MTSPRPAQGRQLNIGVTFLAWLNIYQTLKQIVQDAVAPEIQGLKGEIQGIKGEIKGLSDRIDSLEKRLDNRIDGVDKRMDDFGRQIDGFERQIVIALDVRVDSATVAANFQHTI